MLFYESMPDLRKALIGAGLLKLIPPVTASIVTSSEVAIAQRVQRKWPIALRLQKPQVGQKGTPRVCGIA